MLLSSTVQTEKDQVKRVKIRASGNLCVFRHQSLPLLYCVNFIRLIIGFCSSWFLHLLVFKWHLLCSMLGGGSKDRINLEYLGWSLMPENHSETSKYTNCRFWILVLPPKRSPKCPYDIYSLHLSEFWFFLFDWGLHCLWPGSGSSVGCRRRYSPEDRMMRICFQAGSCHAFL